MYSYATIYTYVHMYERRKMEEMLKERWEETYERNTRQVEIWEGRRGDDGGNDRRKEKINGEADGEHGR